MHRPLARHLLLGVALAGITLTVALRRRFAQDTRYHDLADRRTIAGIPNFLDVTSNAALLVAGAFGLTTLARRREVFETQWEIRPYAALFAGTMFTALGSAWYHLSPDNDRLVWDRLPMTAGFMGLLAATIAERIGVVAGRRLFLPLLALGAGSVVHWHRSESRQAGDLRLYALVQFGSLCAIPLLLLLYPPRYRESSKFIACALSLYLTAKGFEAADHQLLDLTGFVSGHTLKHLTAAASVASIAVMLRRREPFRQGEQSPITKHSDPPHESEPTAHQVSGRRLP